MRHIIVTDRCPFCESKFTDDMITAYDEAVYFDGRKHVSVTVTCKKCAKISCIDKGYKSFMESGK